nr:hypothetical protein [Tanacetum cinerariifolium]
MSMTCFSDQVNALIKDCNDILATLLNKNPYELLSVLTNLEVVLPLSAPPAQVVPPEPRFQEQPKVTQVSEPAPPSPNLPPQTTTDAPIIVSAAKLPILNPNKFDLWKMRIEQYFLMTDYSLWEVILNGDSLAPTRVIKGVVQPVAPTNAEQRLARKNELKARGTLLMALPNKHQLKFNIHKNAKTLMEAIKKRFGGNKETKKRNKTDLKKKSLDDLFNSLKIYEAEVKSSSSASTSTQNIAFVSSNNTDITNEPISAAASVSAVSAKILVSALSNQIDADDIEEMDLKWQMAMLTVRARQFLQRTRRNLGANGPTSMGFDMSKVECYEKVTFLESVGLLKIQERMVQLSLKGGMFQDNALVVLRQKFEKAEQERDDLKLKLKKFQTSSKNLSQLLVSQTNDKTGLGYNTQVFTSFMFDCDEMFTSESDDSLPPSFIYDRYQSGDGYHVVPPPYTGIFMPPKPDLVFHNAPNVDKTVHTSFNVELSLTKPDKDLSHTHRPLTPIIEDWVSDSKDDSEVEISQNVPSFLQPNEHLKNPRPSVKPVKNSIPAANPKTTIPKPKIHGNSMNRKACFVCKSLANLIKDLLTNSMLVLITADRLVTTVVPKPHVTRPRPSKPIVTKPHSPPKRHINRSPSPKASNFPPKVTAVKVPHLNDVKGVQGKWEWKPKCPILDHVSWHSSASMTLKRFDYNDALGRSNGNPKGGKIFGKGKIRTGELDFDDVYFVKELKFNIFSISQMCDKKNSVLFTDTECLVLSPEFKMPDENQVLLRVPKENNMYNVDLKNIVSSGDLTCLFAKATLDEPNLWHKRLGHINFKTMNKLVKCNLVRGLPSKVFENDHTCVACKNGKQHRASCIESQLSLKVKIIRSDNGTEFKNNDLNRFCGMKGIKREFSVPRTPQQNGIAERKNKTLIEAARTMLADSLLPILFWAEAVNTVCYVQNRVLVTKPQNKTLYELLLGRTPSIGFIRPFGCPVTILNTLDALGKFDGKVDEGFLVGYSVSSKAFR